jgi:hypothetical protein
MSIERRTPIYGNCQVFSPEGELMFRCLEKRAKWYLDRNLAVVITDNPLSIKLTFKPKGKGESHELLKMERKNKCVVCGTEDLNVLTKHHLIPFVYRQHFPDNRKKHSSCFVVPICRDCHFKYENEFATQLKSAMAQAYSAPFNGTFDIERSKAVGIINCLIQFGEQIPEDRKTFLREKLRQNMIDLGLYNGEDLSQKESLTHLKTKLESESKDQANNSHGKIVVDRVRDFDEFERMWTKHFIDNMQPKFMPDYFVKTLCSISAQ